MPNTPCLTEVPFSLTGDAMFADQQVAFQLAFDSAADQEAVKAYQWYIDASLVTGQNQPDFSGEISCGSHTIGARILTEEGWSGVKSLAFQTCLVDIAVNYTLDEQTSPYVDVNMQIKDQASGTIIKDLYSTTTGAVSLDSLDEFSVELYAGNDSVVPGAVMYLLVKKNGVQVFEDTKPAITNQQDPGASIVFSDTPLYTDSYEVFGASYSDAAIGYTLSEQPDPFADANLQIKNGDIILLDVFSSGSGSIYAAPNEVVTFIAYTQIASVGANPVMNLTVIRNGETIADKNGPAVPGATLTFDETIQPGANYQVTVTTHTD